MAKELVVFSVSAKIDFEKAGQKKAAFVKTAKAAIKEVFETVGIKVAVKEEIAE